MSATEQEQRTWCAFIEARMRFLIMPLGEQKESVIIHPYPKPFRDPASLSDTDLAELKSALLQHLTPHLTSSSYPDTANTATGAMGAMGNGESNSSNLGNSRVIELVYEYTATKFYDHFYIGMKYPPSTGVINNPNNPLRTLVAPYL